MVGEHLAVKEKETREVEYLVERISDGDSRERSVFVQGGFKDLLLLEEGAVEDSSQSVVLFQILLHQVLLQLEHSLLPWLFGRLHQGVHQQVLGARVAQDHFHLAAVPTQQGLRVDALVVVVLVVQAHLAQPTF